MGHKRNHLLFNLIPTSRASIALIAILIATLLIPQVVPFYRSTKAESKMIGANSPAPQFGIEEPVDGEENSNGLQVILSEGSEQPQEVEAVPLADAEPLPADETQAILDRLPQVEVEEADVQDFRLPEESLGPPRTVEVIETSFPPPEEMTGPVPEEVEAGPLEVVRYAPEGELPIAPFVNVTFNQPMVPLGTIEQLSMEDVPVTLTPELPGVWKWIGTQTLRFEYTEDEAGADRFPKATEYVAEIPAGTTSAIGGVLEEAVQWSFTTPPPQLIFSAPNFEAQPRDPVLFAAFDQAINPAAVLETIQVTAGGQEFPVRLATEEEIAADKRASNLVQRVQEERWLAFRADELFPADTTVVVNIGPNTPSAEGPLTTESVQSFSFRTYAPLRITRAECSYGDECPPLTPFDIVFNNRLDPDLFDKSLISVEPEIPGLVIQNFGRSISIQGATEGRTTYQVTVDGSIQDEFGQTLGEDAILSFTTGSAPRALFGTNESFITLDPSATNPVYTIYSINYERLRARVYAVEPQDWIAYQEYLRYSYQNDPPKIPGRQVMSTIFTIDAEPDVLTETNIDLSEAAAESSQLIVIVDFPPNPLRRNNDDTRIVQSWVQITQIGLDAFTDHSEMVAWATALQDGRPLEGVQLSLLDTNSGSVTDEEGIATFDLPNELAPVLVAEYDGAIAMLPKAAYYWSDDGWSKQDVLDWVRWYVFDDRQMYRPGEEVHVKGWVRRVGGKQDGDVGLLQDAKSVRYQVMDPQGNLIDDGVVDTNDLGGFDLAFTLSENVNLGHANLYLSIPGVANAYNASYNHSFQIQEFRRPEFEVTARTETEAPHLVGGEAIVAVNASYFAGGPLPNAPTDWTVTTSPGHYSPPNWPGFTFGTWIPWWVFRETGFSSGSTQYYSGETDASGTHYLRMEFAGGETLRPYSIRAEAIVMDVNRQAWASSTGLLVHPASLYVGLRSERTFVERGQPLDVQAIVTDLDGNAVEDRLIQMQAVRLEWKYTNGRWGEDEVDLQECELGSQLEPVTCTFETPIGGRYRIRATIEDEMGRANSSEFTRWVSGGKRPTARDVEQEEVTLIPDKETYQPDDTAEILIQSPFTPAEGLLTLSRDGFISTERFQMDEPTYVVHVPIEEAYIPNLHVSVELVGSTPRTDDQGKVVEALPARPAYASGSLNLSIPPLSRILALDVQPMAAELEPGDETTVDVTVTDAGGQTVEGAEVAVVVVDEAILALTNYQLADPISSFYQMRSLGIQQTYGRASIVLMNPELLAEDIANTVEEEMVMRSAMPTAAAAPMMADGGEMAEESMVADAAMDMESMGADDADEADEASPIAVRSNFNPLATFTPAIRTDESGNASVTFKLPDNLTRYRIMVVAVAGGKHFGSAESNITARLPLMVRPAAPRFLNFGDRFELPVVLQNQTDEPLIADVVAQTGNIDLLEGQGLRVEIPANDRREVRFPATTVNAGTARIQLAAVSGSYADAAQLELPVYTPATTEAFATYGVIDEGAIVQPVATPENVFPQFGGLEVSTSSTALSALTDAVLYLVAYPFECSEQLASRIMGVAALRDVLTAFEAEGLPTPEEMEKAVQRDIERLQQLQNFDGGFPIWTKGKESVPYYSIHVAHSLLRAKEKGFDVPDEMLFRALDHLRSIESYYPYWYSERTRQALSSYAVYVRSLDGDMDTLKARNLFNEMPLEEQSLEATSWLWQVLADDPASTVEVAEIRRHVNNRAVETPSAANFTTSYGDQEYLMLHSNRRTDAIVLDAMINDEPENDLIPKVVNGLLAHRNRGHWNNTQENVFVLLALDRYFNTFESITPDFVAQMWLGETYVAAHEFQGRSTETQLTTIPMSYLTDPTLSGASTATAGDLTTQDFILNKDGDGRLYYRLGLSYEPEDLDLDPLDMGFVVQRAYEAIDDPADVRLDEDGVWHIKAGARVRVRVTMVANNRRYHVALVDPLPAGLETINPALAVSESIPQDPNDQSSYGWWWWWSWYEHQNLRDERAEAFTTLLWEGVYDYTYVARATTPGEYVVPPAKAEEMYTPEVFGRSGSDQVIVE